ncbi:MAG: EamA family transporter, partial [Coprococcus sp.]
MLDIFEKREDYYYGQHEKTHCSQYRNGAGRRNFWGLSGVCGQYLFQTKEMTATWLVPVRLFVSGLLLLAFFLAKDAKRTLSVWKNKKTAIDLLIYSFAGIMLCQYAYFQTIEWSNAGTATVVQY